VALARALAREPRVLLLDEPFGALDPVTRQVVRDELADILADLGLPTLVVTHAFDDAAALAHRIGVIDRGRLVQLAPPAELLRRPASVTVAALTGANVLAGTATPAPPGSIVSLDGGGQLVSSTLARGPVHVAIHPWELELAVPEPGAAVPPGRAGTVTDQVVSVRHNRGGLLIRLTRFTLQTRVARGGDLPLTEGTTVGLWAAPTDVRILGPDLLPAPAIEPAVSA
jgi:ABC-type sulfate/molybdate transport systems ATPase subunit